jgi:hypothetical protein
MFSTFRADLVADVEDYSAAFALMSIIEFSCLSSLGRGLAGVRASAIDGQYVIEGSFNHSSAAGRTDYWVAVGVLAFIILKRPTKTERRLKHNFTSFFNTLSKTNTFEE